MIKRLWEFLKAFLVGMTGFEPATSWSQTKRATNCATSRLFFFVVILTGFGLAVARSPATSIPNRLACKASRIPTALHLNFWNGYIIANFFAKVKSFGEFFCNWGRSFFTSPPCFIYSSLFVSCSASSASRIRRATTEQSSRVSRSAHLRQIL